MQYLFISLFLAVLIILTVLFARKLGTRAVSSDSKNVLSAIGGVKNECENLDSLIDGFDKMIPEFQYSYKNFSL